MDDQKRDDFLKKGFLKTYRVSPYDTDAVGRLKIGSIFNWLQDSMDEYSTALGVGTDYCYDHGISYALRGYNVDIASLPTFGASVPVHTRLKCLTPISFVLQHRMYDPSLRRALLSACSEVVLLNVANGHWTRSKRCLPSNITENVPTEPYIFPSVPHQERVDSVRDEIVPWDYIDFNQHVNNTKYIEMAARAVSPERLKEMQLRRIAAAFKRAARCGEHLQIQTQMDPFSSVHRIISKDKEDVMCAKVYFEWQKQKMLFHERCRTNSEKRPEETPKKAIFNIDKVSDKNYNFPVRKRGVNGYVY